MRIARATLLFALVVSAVSSAQTATDPFRRGIDAVPMKMTPTFNPGLILDGAETPYVGTWSLQAMLDFNVGIMALNLGTQRLGDLLPFRFDVHLMGSYQVLPRVEVAVDLPITAYQISNFSALTAQGFPQESPHAAGLGDLRLMGRFSLFSQKTFPIGVAAVAEVRLPTGDDFSFLGDKGVVFAPRAVLERQLGPIRLLANVGWRLRTTYGQYLNLYVAQEFILGGGVGISLPDFSSFTRNSILAELNTATPAEAPFTQAGGNALKTPFEAMVGFRTNYDQHWSGQLAIGKGLGSNGYGRETIRVVVSARYAFETESDRDGDGIPDRIDQCPDVPEDKDGYQDEDGCPEPDPDSDGDGVPDQADGCKDQPGPKDYDGCPDRDGDQIPDNVDKCPDEPGPAETEGCPVPKDEEVVLESDRIRIRGNILFETAQAVIQRQSYPMLDDVAKVLVEHPEVGPVLIEGHTDDRGSRPYNLDLSNRRAKAVADYLVSKGIDRKRLRTAGFGFDRPVATNDTPLGRAKNRRTEFRLVEEDGSLKKLEDKSIQVNKPGATIVPKAVDAGVVVAPVPVQPIDAGVAVPVKPVVADAGVPAAVKKAAVDGGVVAPAPVKKAPVDGGVVVAPAPVKKASVDGGVVAPAPVKTVDAGVPAAKKPGVVDGGSK